MIRYYIQYWEDHWTFSSAPPGPESGDVREIVDWLREQNINVSKIPPNKVLLTTASFRYYVDLTPAQVTYLELRWGSRPDYFLNLQPTALK